MLFRSYAEATDFVVIESVFTNNVVEGDSSWVDGGGLSVLGSTGTVTGSTFTGNDLFELQNTYTYGGGLAFDGESLTVSDTTFSGNYMDSDASGTFALPAAGLLRVNFDNTYRCTLDPTGVGGARRRA